MNEPRHFDRTIGVSSLERVHLSPQNEALLARARVASLGNAVWRARKLAEFREVLALSQLSQRFVVIWTDLSAALRMAVSMKVPVPCLRGHSEGLRIATGAVLALHYREQIVREPQPGYSFVQILEPSAVWHANVARDPGQPLCLGPQLPPNIPLREILMLAYGALSFQTVQLDALDPAGVMNPEGAAWWLDNRNRIPLTREPFIHSPLPST